MTSGLMFKVTIALLVVSVASYVTLGVMADAMGETELLRVAIDRQRIFKHPIVMAVAVSHIMTKVAAAVSAVTTAVLWMIGV